MKTKLVLIVIVFMIYPIIVIGYFGYRNYAGTMTEKAISDMQSSANELSELISDRMTKLSLFAVQILYDNKIYEAGRKIADGSFDYEAVNEFNAYLQSSLYLKSELDEILVRFTWDGRIFAVNKNMGSYTDSFTHIDQLYEQAKRSGGRPVWHATYEDGRAKGLYITKIIFDIYDIKKEIGLIVFKVNEQYLTEVLNNYMANTRQHVSLYGSDGREVYSYKPPGMDLGGLMNEFVGKDSGDGTKEIKSGNDTVYLLNGAIMPDNWRLAMGISSNVLLKEVRDIARLILILCAATLPICVLVANFFYSDIIRPVNLLVKRMHQVEKGDIGITIDDKREDEFGYMNKTFNRMSIEIKNLINTVYKKQIATKDAEIKALQAQINPHFLYNTLDSINWKAKINGVEEISEMVSALSSIIEANLNRNNEKFILLGKEIEYINNYYFLLKKRYGKKIDLILDVEQETLNCVIPKLIIQPIVENAVYHGLEMKVGRGSIHLKAVRNGGVLVIEITDDGIGIDEDILDRLDRSLAEIENDDMERFEGDDALIGPGIGIINVHKRIRLLYGKEYGLLINSRKGQGTSVTISLPAIFGKTGEGFSKGAEILG
ncbi:MAG: histidine kinase [Bacillota bacterium]